MRMAGWWLFPLALLLRAGAELVLDVPATHGARLGSETVIPCTFTVDRPRVDRSFLIVFWHFEGKQILKLEDELVVTDGRFYLNATRAENGDASLSISRVSLFDIGIYNCTILYSLELRTKGVPMSVHAPPKITITKKLAVIGQESILRGLITGFYPSDIGINWYRDGDILRNSNQLVHQRNLDGTYNVESIVPILLNEKDTNQSFSCRVQHGSLSEALNKDFQLEYAAPPEITITERIVTMNRESTLRGSINGFYPADISIKWFRDRKELNNYMVFAPQRNPDGTYSVNSTATITPTEKDKHRIFSCGVQHESLPETQYRDFQLEFADEGNEKNKLLLAGSMVVLLSLVLYFVLRYHRNRRNLAHRVLRQDSVPLIVSGSRSRPRVEGITVPDQLLWKQEVRLQCQIARFYPNELTVKWFKKERNAEGMTPVNPGNSYHIPDLQPEKQQDNTYSCTACLVFIPSPESDQGTEFLCQVYHPNLDRPIERRTKALHIKDFVSRPQMDNITVPDQILWDQPVKLICEISGFYPKNLTVTWLKQEAESQRKDPVDPENFQISNVISAEQPDGTYSCTACLEFTPTLKTHGIKFICRAKHSSLPRMMEKRTKPLEIQSQSRHWAGYSSEAGNPRRRAVRIRARSEPIYDRQRRETSVPEEDERKGMGLESLSEEPELDTSMESPIEKNTETTDKKEGRRSNPSFERKGESVRKRHTR
uniref:Ig-like domain-containing protein n=1 Tax=Leptobrachium leishanense TaxID=445787 RepID=A0A8C5WIQ1_9ANUR